MSYATLFTHKQPRIPIIGFFIVLSVMFIFLSKFLGSPPVRSRANLNLVADLKIVNMSPNQVGIVWRTDHRSIGWLVYGTSESSQDRIVLDERDIADKKNTYTLHYVLVRNLEANTTYYFKLVDNNQLVGDGQNKAFSFKTISQFTSGSDWKPAYGKAVLTNGSPLQNGIVLLSFENAYPLVALTKESGEWLISLNSVVDFSTDKKKDIKTEDIAQIMIYGEEGKTAIKTNMSSLSPLPQTTILGTDYDFTHNENVLGAKDTASQQTRQGSVEVSYPKQGAVIPGKSPLVKGTAAPGSQLRIVIGGPRSFSFTVQADKTGQWVLPITEVLPAGDYVLSAVLTNSKNTGVLVERKFTIVKSGEQVVLGEATNEATPTTNPTVLPSGATATPTSVASLSGTLLTPTTPVTGSSPLPVVAVSGVLMILGLGLLLAF